MGVGVSGGNVTTRRLGLFGTAVAMAFAVGVGASWADHQFSDVRDPSFFHESITAIADAGCALGFSDGRFQPNASATRGQFAFWLHNCGGRLAFNEQTAALSSTFTDYASATMTAGAAGTGSGFALVSAAVEARSANSSVGLPCEITVRLTASGASFVGSEPTMRLNLLDGTSDASEEENGTLMGLVALPAGQSVTVAANSRVDNSPSCTAPIVGDFSVSALYVPFAGDGSGGSL